MNTTRALAATLALVAVALGFALLPAPNAAAQGAPLHVLASTAVKTVLEAVRPQCEKAVGHPLAITYGTSGSMKQSIEAGDPFDVVIMASDTLDVLAKEGKFAPGSRPVARAALGVGVRANGPKPDVSTPEALKKAILEAKGVTYTAGGASGPLIDKMADRLGITAQLKAKTVSEPTAAGTIAHMVDGSADLIFNFKSEILPIQGLQWAGPFPSDFDRYLNFSAAISAKAADPKSSAALIKYLTSKAVLSTLNEKGMEPVKPLKK